MSDQIKVTGMILKAESHGEADKRLVILTKEKGKISVFANGARKATRGLSAATEPFSFGEFTLREWKNSYSIADANIINYFEGFLESLDAACFGMYFLELADYYTRENNDESEVLKLLYQSLRALLHEQYDNRLVKAIFELKMIMINGEYPGPVKEYEYHDGALYTLDYIYRSSIEKLYSFSLTKELLDDVVFTAKIYVDQFIDRKLKSLEILQGLIYN